MSEKDSGNQLNDDKKFILADKVIKLTLLLVIIMSTILITGSMIMASFNAACEGMEVAKGTFSALLPLIGAWVGTIIAYYFSEKNFEAANRSMKDMVDRMPGIEKLRATPVKGKMISLKDMTHTQIDETETVNTKLADLVNLMNNPQDKVNRLPVLFKNNRPRYVIHRSMIDKFFTSQLMSVANITIDKLKELTLKELLDKDPHTKKIFENSFAIVSEESTLADAKLAMDQLPDCRDIFVTKSGTRQEPVIGWITNNILVENAKV